MTTLLILLTAAVTLIAISLQRTYGSVPLKELKRRARAGDTVAATLHRAAAYGSSLRTLLWALIVVLAALFCVLVAGETAAWFAVLLGAVLLWFGFVWLPAQDATKAGVWLAAQAAPVLDKVLQYLHPALRWLQQLVRRHRPITLHTGLYDKADLTELFSRQKVQADNRVDSATLEIVEHALQFGDKKVSDILTPARVVKSVSADETIGALLMTDLHGSGFSRFPVFEGKKSKIVGILYLRDLVKARSGGAVSKVMSTTLCYVHEDQPLTEALQAVLKTHQQLFIVVNTFEEYVGIVTLEDILEEIVGKQIVDEFDQYEDLRAVAAKLAQKEHKEHLKIYSPHENFEATEYTD
jgi:CBS domain containing-hemolysin-like protein